MNLVSFSFSNLKRRKVRTALVILGITIGVMLVTSLLTILDGFEAGVSQSIELLSGNVIIQKEGSIDQALSIIDASIADAIAETGYAKAVSPEIYVVRQIGPTGTFSITTLIGITEAYSEIVSPEFITRGEAFDAAARGEAIVGTRVAKRLGLDLGDTFEVEPLEFRVVGIFETNTLADAAIVLIPLDDARALSGLPGEKISAIEVRPLTPEDTERIEEFVENNYDDVEVVYPKDLVAEAQQVLGTIQDITFIVSSIAVLVAAIGIANAMLMSVMERTPEIGVLKATGWRNLDIGYSLFLEAILMAFVGGILGVAVGVLAAFAAAEFIPQLSIHLSYGTLLLSFGFSVLLAVLSALYPAVKASRISPIVAIRGE